MDYNSELELMCNLRRLYEILELHPFHHSSPLRGAMEKAFAGPDQIDTVALNRMGVSNQARIADIVLLGKW